jgi:hypothetical protein
LRPEPGGRSFLPQKPGEFTDLCYNEVFVFCGENCFSSPKPIITVMTSNGTIAARHASNVKEALYQMTFDVCR